MEAKFLIRSDEDYHEFNLRFCQNAINGFKKRYFRKNSKHPARIYVKAFFPPDCPEQWWMYYLVFEVNGKPNDITSITKDAFNALTEGIEPSSYTSIEFYTIAKHELINEA
jgi:hypothetical protein